MLVYCQFIWDLIPWWGWGLLTFIHMVIVALSEENKVLQAICTLNFYLLWFGFALPVWGDNEGSVIFGVAMVSVMVLSLLGLDGLFETEKITTPKQYVRAYGKCYECKEEVDKFIRKCPYCQTEY